jgi:hypothetical protein
MKNVHVLPTEKPSRLYKDQNNVFKLDIEAYGSGSQYIYITSDEVKKHGDWVISNLNEVTTFRSLYCQNEYRKIILTTNQDLIKDGVQDIDKEFLEWFVKNPSCESVVVVNDEYVDLYKIITPEEEPEQTDEKGRPVTYWGSLQEPKQEWSPSQGEEVWIKVFSNWLKGRYIGYDVTEQVYIAREDKKDGRYLSSSKILPYYAMPNDPESETQDFKVWDELFGILAWKFQPTKSGDRFLDAEKVFEELKSKFKLERL